jgi:hypothetical protein
MLAWVRRLFGVKRTPEFNPIVIAVADQNPVKDVVYWETVASVLGNKPFIQELLEAQQRYEREMASLALEDNFDPQKIRESRLKLFTIKNFAAHLAMAPIKAQELERQQSEE